jgi:hypothetical protein
LDSGKRAKPLLKDRRFTPSSWYLRVVPDFLLSTFANGDDQTRLTNLDGDVVAQQQDAANDVEKLVGNGTPFDAFRGDEDVRDQQQDRV